VGDLRAELAAIIAHPTMPANVRRFESPSFCDRCTRALRAADALLAAGWVKAPPDWQTQLEQAYAEGEGAAKARLLALGAVDWRALAEMAVSQLGWSLDAMQLIRMDTCEDRERHNRAIATFREFEVKALAVLRGGAQ
jgi:hypothetical protein